MTRYREYRVNGAYGYWMVAEYLNGKQTQIVISGITKKLATSIASALRSAIHAYELDNNIKVVTYETE